MSDREENYEDKEAKEAENKLGSKLKSYTDVQRYKLEKLMANPAKPVHIPNRAKEKNVNTAPEFCHNIMGSSAGAGSGEFHLYRQMRRKEQNRLKVLGERREKDDLNSAYHQKLEENEKWAEERTAKRRKKRQKKKNNKKNAKKQKMEDKSEEESEESEDSEAGPEKQEEPEKEKNNATPDSQGETEPTQTIVSSLPTPVKSPTAKKVPLVVYFKPSEY